MYYAGVDLGAVATKTVIMDDTSEITAYDIIRTGSKSKAAAEQSIKNALKKCRLNLKDLSYVVATGYGRVNAEYASKQVSEIACHALGAFKIFPTTRTIIDIGGQDSKAIQINEHGEVIDFNMNDKCAAGTGRFLEVMASALEIDIETMGPFSLKAQKKTEISSMCTVFAESEVVSLIAEGAAREDIANGLHNAVVNRVLGLAHKLKIRETITLTGGVINNIGIVHAIKNKLGLSVNIPDEPQIIGALGAALMAKRAVRKREKIEKEV